MDYIRNMLEFEEIIHMCKEHTVTQTARNKMDELMPILNEKELRRKMRDTTEARKLVDIYGAPPLSAVADIRKTAEEAQKGALLSIEELESISRFAVLSMRVIRYLKKSEELNLQISEFGNGMVDLELLREEIDRCIRNGRVDDLASRELRDIRRKQEQILGNIRTKLESILKSKKECFSECFVSNRNGHYTLPVKKEHKLQISGSVIDVSSSGATYFIEPSSVAKLKEELEVLAIAENNEEKKILYTLSSGVGDFENEIIMNLEYIEELDYIFAKAKLSSQMHGIEPGINTDRIIRIRNGRHPLLSREKCVPLNLEMGMDNRGIVITGPNTGGKTVALKAVGLFSVMAQCGLHIPSEEADLCMNTKVLCDIGDGQSISENLSTFSAHMKNIISIMRQVDQECLVLMDELGSGTDPTEGMGIAVAILDELRACHCNFIVTTHYPQVKEYAGASEGIINARMAFDKESLEPLYRLEMGAAGESCALYIARRLGMPVKMLKRAYEESRRSMICGYTEDSVCTDRDDFWQVAPEASAQEDHIGKDIIKIQKSEPEKQMNQRSERFQVGDSVMVYPQKKIGIVFEKANVKGEVGVQIQKRKIYVNHKRLQRKASANDMYPEDYDFSIIFDTVENRKARHAMNRKHVPGLKIVHDTNNQEDK